MARPPAPANSSTLRIEKPPYRRTQPRQIAQLAFPDCQHLPSSLYERLFIASIAQFIAFELGRPEIKARLGHSRENAVSVPMPEAAMHEDNLVPGFKNEVRPTGKILLVKTITVAEREYQLADQQLRSRVFGTHPRHDK
jgi:hypothetical protein